jgi:DNA mismatch repair ATPase MutS
MEFAVREGIYTTINLPDDLTSGSSHFYTEVLRIKKIARELAKAKNLFLIFDELFRGTNVKDAYEGTVAVTAAFAERENCVFVISTHITEAGEILKERCNNIHFVFLPTRMENNKPVYTYQLAEGITTDRHGMLIINNEGILDIIRRKKDKNKDI